MKKKKNILKQINIISEYEEVEVVYYTGSAKRNLGDKIVERGKPFFLKCKKENGKIIIPSPFIHITKNDISLPETEQSFLKDEQNIHDSEINNKEE